MSPEMCTALLKSVQVVFSNTASVNTLPEPGYARSIEVISSLLAELPFGSPQRSQAVGLLTSICDVHSLHIQSCKLLIHIMFIFTKFT